MPLFLLLWLLAVGACAPKLSAPDFEPAPSPAVSSHPEAATFRVRRLKVGQEELIVELACTPAERQQGLMFRQELASDRGMLFVFERAQNLSFWMRNTLIPLSIAYIDESGIIVDIQDLEPLDETPVPAAQPAQYALELNQGWFSQHDVQIGDAIQLDSFCADPTL